MSLYRGTVFFLRGLREFTRSGFERASRSFQESDLDVDVSGKSFMITGSNSGIGKVTALEIAKRGGTVHMVCRSEERALAAKQEIIEASGNERVHVHIVDLSKPKDVISFCHKFIADAHPLNMLVNNAGCMVNERTHQEDDLEVNFATNTLGTFLITKELLPVLEKSENPRVITVSSGGMYNVKLDPDDLNLRNMRSFDGTIAYAHNKRQQIVLTRLWSKEYPNIYFAAMHPGWADTPAVRNSMPSFHRRMGDRLRSPEQGADTLVWLCLSKELAKDSSGSFFQDRSITGEHLPLAWTRSTEADERRFMDNMEQLRLKFLPSGAQ